MSSTHNFLKGNLHELNLAKFLSQFKVWAFGEILASEIFVVYGN